MPFDNRFPRGSEWRRWDMHVYTPESVLNNQYGNDWDAYAKALFEKALEREVYAIGVTDYFHIEGYKKLKNYKENDAWLTANFGPKGPQYIDKIKSLLLLPNIEFRLSDTITIESKKENGEVKRDSRRVNIHVIISNEIEPKDIEDFFLHNIKFIEEANPQEEDQCRPLKIQDLEELGKRLKKEHDGFTQSDLFVGMMSAVVKADSISKILRGNNKFKDKYLIVLAEEGLSFLDWNQQDHQTRKLLLQRSDAIFSANAGTRAWALGEKHNSVDEFIAEFKSLKPCLWGSDAHSYDEMFEPDNQSYLWVKADVTFQGLKQVVYEPKERVAIQAIEPERKMVDEYIDSIRFRDVNGRDMFPDDSIVFNKNMTTIIGGKSSGKSLLLYYIAKSIQPELIKKMMESKAIPTIYSDKTPDGFDFEVKWADERIDKLSSPSEENRRNVTFIPQFYINKLAEDSEKETLRKIIYDIIIEQSSSTTDYSETLGRIDQLIDEIESQITLLFQIRNQLLNIVEELGKYGDKNGKKKKSRR